MMADKILMLVWLPKSKQMLNISLKIYVRDTTWNVRKFFYSHIQYLDVFLEFQNNKK